MKSRIPTEAQALRHLRKHWTLSDHRVLIQPIETSTGAGVPDLYLWIGETRRAWWCELKRGNRRLTSAQTRWMLRTQRLGHRVCVIRVWHDYRFTLHLPPSPPPDPVRVFRANELYAVLSTEEI